MEQTTATEKSLLSVSSVGWSSCVAAFLSTCSSHSNTQWCVFISTGYKRMADFKDSINKLMGLHVSALFRGL